MRSNGAAAEGVVRMHTQGQRSLASCHSYSDHGAQQLAKNQTGQSIACKRAWTNVTLAKKTPSSDLINRPRQPCTCMHLHVLVALMHIACMTIPAQQQARGRATQVPQQCASTTRAHRHAEPSNPSSQVNLLAPDRMLYFEECKNETHPLNAQQKHLGDNHNCNTLDTCSMISQLGSIMCCISAPACLH